MTLTYGSPVQGSLNFGASIWKIAGQQQVPSTWGLESLVQCEAEFRMRLTWLADEALSLVEKWNPSCWEQSVRGPGEFIAARPERLRLESTPGQSCLSQLCILSFVVLIYFSFLLTELSLFLPVSQDTDDFKPLPLSSEAVP